MVLSIKLLNFFYLSLKAICNLAGFPEEKLQSIFVMQLVNEGEWLTILMIYVMKVKNSSTSLKRAKTITRVQDNILKANNSLQLSDSVLTSLDRSNTPSWIFWRILAAVFMKACKIFHLSLHNENKFYFCNLVL